MQGKLIVIEGLDGSGKSTQWDMLQKNLKNFLFITFPDYESESGKIIKQYLSGNFGGVDASEGAFSASSFYAVDRYISYKTGWGEDLQKGTDIVSARYTSSNIIYQMAKLPENQWTEYLGWLYDYEHRKLGIPKADLTVFLDVPIEISQKLLNKRYENEGTKDIHEGNIKYLEKCRKSALYAAEKYNWVMVDCVRDGILRNLNDINDELIEIIKKRLPELGESNRENNK